MATAKRAPVASTTKPTISSGDSNVQTGGDMTRGVGSPRKNSKLVKGKTPGSNVQSAGSNRHYGAIVDRDNTGLHDSVLPAGAQRGTGRRQ